MLLVSGTQVFSKPGNSDENPSLSATSVRTLGRGFVAKSGQENKEITDFRSLSSFFAVCLKFIWPEKAEEWAQDRLNQEQAKKSDFDWIAYHLISAPIELELGDRTISIGKFKLIEKMENEQPVITIVDTVNQESLQLPPGYGLDELKLKALLYKAATDIISAEIDGQGTLALDGFSLTEGQENDVPFVIVRNTVNQTETKIPRITLHELQLQALLSLAGEEIIDAEIVDQKSVVLKNFTLTQGQQEDELFIKVMNLSNGTEIMLPAISLRDLKLRALDTFSAEEKAAMIFGSERQGIKSELADLFCVYAKLKAALKIDKDFYGNRVADCVEYLDNNYDQVTILEGIYRIKTQSGAELARVKMINHVDYCNNEAQQKHTTGNPIFGHLYGEASSAVGTLYSALLALNNVREKAKIKADAQAKLILGDPDKGAFTLMNAELTQIYCTYADFLATLDVNADYRDQSVRCALCVNYLKQNPEARMRLNQIFPMDDHQRKEKALDKSRIYGFNCVDLNRAAQNSGEKLKATFYGVAISAVNILYHALKELNREEANEVNSEEAKRLFGDTSDATAPEMKKGLATLFCMFMDFNVVIKSNREDRDEKLIQYLHIYPEQLGKLREIFYGDGDSANSRLNQYIEYCSQLYVDAENDDLAGEYESFKVVVGTLYSAMISQDNLSEI